LSVGACQAGQMFCLADGKLTSLCLGQVVPQVEVCDGVDNDCNGKVDDGITCDCKPSGELRKCFSGPQKSANVGACKTGTQSCTRGNEWSSCLAEVLPSAEICDGLDNDCNGKVDDGIACNCKPGDSKNCYTGPSKNKGVGSCKEGTQFCGANNDWASCVGDVLPSAEFYDGIDNDCDGTVDNNIAPTVLPSSSTANLAPVQLTPKTNNAVGTFKGAPNVNKVILQVPWKTANFPTTPGALLRCELYDKNCGSLGAQEVPLQQNLNQGNPQILNLPFTGKKCR
jgi:hypothetical protein